MEPRGIHGTIALVATLVLALTNLAPQAADAVTGSIPAGTNPTGVAVNPETGRIYVANRGSNTVTVIDAATDGVIATIAEGGVPTAVAVNTRTNRVYVTNLIRTVSVIDGATNAVIASIGVGLGPFSIAVNAETDRVYVANLYDHNLSVIDSTTNSVIATLNTPDGANGIAVNPRTNRVYLTNGSSGSVSVIDGATNTVVAAAVVGGQPYGVAVNSETNRLYVATNPTLTVMDATTLEITATIEAEGGSDVAVDTARDRVYTGGFGKISVIDGRSNTELGFVDIGTFSGGSIEANPRTGKVYVPKYFLSAVAVIALSDLSAPTITPAVTPAPNESGWNNGSVTVSWTVSDPDTGVASSSGCGPSTFTTGTDGRVTSCTATNGDGLSATRSVKVKIDVFSPFITATATTASGNRYFPGLWSTEAVTVHYTCVDLHLPTIASSGLATCAGDQTFTDEGTVTTSGTATDNAGNLATVAYGPIRIDRTAPTIIASATTADGNAYPAGSWTNQPVTVHYTCTDPLSGVVGCTSDQLFSYDTSADGTASAGTARDIAGNTAHATFGPIRIDRTAPTIAFSGNAGTYEVDQAVGITCEAGDALSGIATTTCPTVAAGPATDYVGTSPTTEVMLIATAADNAGNSTSATTSFTVAVTTRGICRLTASLRHAGTLCARVTSIASAPNAMARAGELHALDNFLASQRDVSDDLASLLGRLVRLI
ncbi:MAG TPA: YncE family protein [Candidatus Limnocylindria bacterium]